MRVRRQTVRLLWQGWLALLLITLGVGGTIAAQATWVAPYRATAAVSAASIQSAQAAAMPVVFTPTQALTGSTGTAELPPLPVPAAVADALAAAEPGVVAAQPFALGAASALDRARALRCLADAIYYEAASEPDEGQRAVAQVVLNRVRHPAFPATVCGVIYQGSERGGCQFSFACDGAMARVPSRTGWARAARAAAAALAGYVYAPVGLATHYHTYAVTPVWNRSLVMTDVVGAHFFHRWKGYWGTAAAFSQRYAGGEPLPAPHPPAATPALTPVTLAAAASAAPAPLSTILPEHAQASVALAAPPTPAAEDHLPPASTVLDRWKDSGKPLQGL